MKSILFLHGALNSAAQFDALKPNLAANYHVHTLNFSGHGGNFMPIGGLSFDIFVNDILNYLNANKLDKINLFGYSMGGYAALLFALKYPERVDKIFTCSTKLKWDLKSATKETEFLNPEKMLEKVPAFANNLMVLHGMNVWKNLLNSTSDMLMDLAKGKLILDEDFAKISATVMLAVGDKDKTANYIDTVDVFKLIPNSQLAVLPNTPHEFNKINERLLLALICEFFGN